MLDEGPVCTGFRAETDTVLASDLVMLATESISWLAPDRAKACLVRLGSCSAYLQEEEALCSYIFSTGTVVDRDSHRSASCKT